MIVQMLRLLRTARKAHQTEPNLLTQREGLCYLCQPICISILEPPFLYFVLNL